MVAVDGAYGLKRTTYLTEIFSFSKIVSFRDSTNSTYSKVFPIIYKYCNTNDSKSGPIGHRLTKKWHLNKIEDYVGNSIDYFYNNDLNYCYLNS